MPQVNFAIAFAAGILGFLSPCIVPLVPGYISFVSGLSLADMDPAARRQHLSRIVGTTVVFVLGFASIFTAGLILYDQGRHVNVATNIAQRVDKDWEWPAVLAPFQNVRALQTGWEWELPVPERAQLGPGEHDGELNWPTDFDHVAMPFNGTSGPDWMRWPKPDFLPGWMQALYWYDLNMNFPAFLVEIFIPVAIMVGLPALQIYILRRLGWVHTVRDGAIAIFTGMMMVYLILTVIGAGFRGAGQDLVLPWDVPAID